MLVISLFCAQMAQAVKHGRYNKASSETTQVHLYSHYGCRVLAQSDSQTFLLYPHSVLRNQTHLVYKSKLRAPQADDGGANGPAMGRISSMRYNLS